MLVGLGEPDDAAIYRINDETALIATTDFFTPIVDDPWTYGAIAAANSMSDVYAMGGEVLYCLNIAAMPESLGYDVIGQIFAGGAVKVREAGAALAGGHTVTSPEPFYGLAVTGTIHPAQIIRKGGARPGDKLFLTKKLGTGIIATAAKLTGPGESAVHRMARRAQGKRDLDPAHLDEAVLSMMTLNRAAAVAGRLAGVRGGTDITGFGFLGHACEMMAGAARHHVTGFQIRAAAVPVLPGVWEYLAAGYTTAALKRNPAHFGDQVRFGEQVTAAQRAVLWEAETSGGLFLAVPAGQAERFGNECADRNQPCWEIGEVTDRAGIEVV
jgi:selenide, water dikinase